MRKSNIVWSVNGLFLPLLMAALLIPSIIKNIGMEKFGLLSLSWGLIGYAGVFDLGIGRATTQIVARYVGEQSFSMACSVLKVSEKISWKVGSLVTMVFLIVVFFWGGDLFNYSLELKRDVYISLFIVGFTIPFQCLSTMYRGYCEAFGKFRAVNLIRICLGVINFLAPFVVSIFSSNVWLMILSLFLSRVIAVFLYKYTAKTVNTVGSNNGLINESVETIKKELLKFGGWYTISSIISPFLVQMDKFFIGKLLSITAIGLYSLPYEVVTKMIIFVSAVSSVALPQYAKLITKNRMEAHFEFNMWLRRVACIMGFGCSVMYIFLPHILTLWIGTNISDESIKVGEIMCIGIFFNSIGIMYYTYIHAYGDTKSTAIAHLIELPIYILILILLINDFGLIGAAWAWTLRVLIDLLILFFVFRRKVKVFVLAKCMES